jgi:5-methylcytosine-specific restriction endonuclease McrA
MARIRSVHPGLWTDEAFVSVSPMARLCLLEMWSVSEGPGLVCRREVPATLLKAGLARIIGNQLYLCRDLGKPGLPMPGRAAVSRHLAFWRNVRHAKTWAERGTGVTFTAWRQIRDAVLRRDNHACRYCGQTSGRIECDHVVPIARGGRTVPDNLVAACRSCNRRKGIRTLSEWRSA